MTQFLSSIVPVANHLWQSTAFVVAAYLVTLLLHRNRASVRYGIWLAASAKFLIPFSLLIGLGGLLPRPQHIVASSQTTIYSAMGAVGQPFSSLSPEIASMVGHPSLKQSFLNALPMILLGAWLVGFAAVLLVWAVRWHQVSATLRRAKRVEDGREVQLLRRVEQAMGTRRPILLLLSRDLMEPGIFGIFRPVLIWPEQLSERLGDEHIDAILAHELMHVRRRDNLAAAMHMAVEAAFWFHPMAWWMERRMVEERERACDEAVVEMGSKPGIYADSLLKACRFCVESPLTCVAGVTGADLKKRVRSIMTLRLEKLNFGKKLALAAIGLAVVAGPVAFGLMEEAPIARVFHPTPPLPSFDVATIKPVDPGGSTPPNGMTVRSYIRLAYSPAGGPLPPTQVVGGPEWLDKDPYSITGKPPADLELAMQKMRAVDRFQQDRAMRQSLLADRFHLKVHFEVRELPIYALVPAKGGLKIKAAAYPDSSASDGPSSSPGPGKLRLVSGDLIIEGAPGGPHMRLWAHTISMAQLAGMLGTLQTGSGSDRPVVDQTGFAGYFDIDGMKWGPLISATPSDSPDLPTLDVALEETLGLRLVATKGPVEVVVIDHIEQPSPN